MAVWVTLMLAGLQGCWEPEALWTDGRALREGGREGTWVMGMGRLALFLLPSVAVEILEPGGS